MQQITGNRSFGKTIDILRHGDDDFAPCEQRHLWMAHVMSRAIGEKHPERLKRLTVKMFLDFFGSHENFPGIGFFKRSCNSIVAPPFLAVNGNRLQYNKKATPAEDISSAGVFMQMVVIESQDLKKSG
jgi:hypothetical protein